MVTQTRNVLPVVRPADGAPGPAQGCWTYEDYRRLPDDGNRYEIIDGVLYIMPAPRVDHQNVVIWFLFYFRLHIELLGLGKVYGAPVDVLLPPHGRVVQPDVLLILEANLGIVLDTHIDGAPDLAVEVASPSTRGYDRREKMDAYAASGVSEYWIAEPDSQTIEVFWLVGGRYLSQGLFTGTALLPSRVAPGFPVEAAKFFV